MPWAPLVATVGLAMDILGAFLIWRFGLPADISRSGAMCLELETKDHSQKEEARRYDRRSTAGFVILMLGFGLQIVGTWLAWMTPGAASS